MDPLTQHPQAHEALAYHRDVVSLAARVGTLDVLVDEKLPGFVASVRTFFQNVVRSAPKFHVVDNRNLVRNLKDGKVQYTDIAKLSIYVPPGLSCDYLTWLDTLEEAADITLTIEERVLDPFLSWVGLLASDDSRMLSRRVKEGLADTEFANLEQIKSDIDQCHDRRGKDEAPYGDVLSRNKDWDAVIERTNTLNERTARVNPSTIHEKTETLVGYLESLSKALSDPDYVDKLNDEYGKLFNRDIVQTLSQMTYDVALEIEFFSVYVYYLETTTQAVEDSIAKLRKSLKV